MKCWYCKEELGFEAPEGIVGLYAGHEKCKELHDEGVDKRYEADLREQERRIAERKKQPPYCNMCGESCLLGPSGDNYGLKAKAQGGYYSTAGNGFGALDDLTEYSFRLCEFCLDLLFQTFRIPVELTNYQSKEAISEPWAPAEQRIKQDPHRNDPETFQTEAMRRDLRRTFVLGKK